MEQHEEKTLTLNQETLDVIVTNIIPTSKYFEARFDQLSEKVGFAREEVRSFKADVDISFNRIHNELDSFKDAVNERFRQIDHRFEQSDEHLREFKADVARRFIQVDKRFEQVDQRFEQVDKRFEQVDKRFEQVDKRFEQVDRRFEQMEESMREFKADVSYRFEQVDERFGEMISAINRLSDRIDGRDAETRSFVLRMFSISIMISFLGVLAVFLKVFNMV